MTHAALTDQTPIRPAKCKSGLTGWQGRLHTVYLDLDEWKAYCRNYGLHRRLGYRSAVATWRANPVVQGSVDPSDYRKVRD
jgi:hypothetical protein